MNAQGNAWYVINNIEAFDSPALVVYPARVKENIITLKNMIDDVKRLRPHIKTHKTREVSRMLMDEGITKFKCATIAEADMLAAIGAKDVLLAYQPAGPKIARFIALMKHYPATKFSCLVDDADAARNLAAIATREGVVVTVFLDINVGMNRTGIASLKAVDLYSTCRSLEGIQPVGLHVYDGHLGGPDLQLRRQQCNDAFHAVDQLANAIREQGQDPIIVAGGSPSFPIHAARKNVECSPGTFVYWDAGYLQQLPEQKFLPASLVITRIISLPDETTVCTDLGHKSVAAENLLVKRVSFLNAPELIPVAQSEEHLVLKTEAGHDYKIGDVLYGLPYHICPTCALYSEALTVNEGKINGAWEVIARNRKINY
jgi:D-serine deaminase-like pyridoxal phosphate-dependent protein